MFPDLENDIEYFFLYRPFPVTFYEISRGLPLRSSSPGCCRMKNDTAFVEEHGSVRKVSGPCTIKMNEYQMTMVICEDGRMGWENDRREKLPEIFREKKENVMCDNEVSKVFTWVVASARATVSREDGRDGPGGASSKD